MCCQRDSKPRVVQGSLVHVTHPSSAASADHTRSKLQSLRVRVIENTIRQGACDPHAEVPWHLYLVEYSAHT